MGKCPEVPQKLLTVLRTGDKTRDGSTMSGWACQPRFPMLLVYEQKRGTAEGGHGHLWRYPLLVD